MSVFKTRVFTHLRSPKSLNKVRPGVSKKCRKSPQRLEKESKHVSKFSVRGLFRSRFWQSGPENSFVKTIQWLMRCEHTICAMQVERDLGVFSSHLPYEIATANFRPFQWFLSTFNPFQSMMCNFQSISVSPNRFQSLLISFFASSLTRSKTKEFINNRKVGLTMSAGTAPFA